MTIPQVRDWMRPPAAHEISRSDAIGGDAGCAAA
jgi:hypothetical protein